MSSPITKNWTSRTKTEKIQFIKDRQSNRRIVVGPAKNRKKSERSVSDLQKALGVDKDELLKEIDKVITRDRELLDKLKELEDESKI
jgi:predicted PhzF superfamily epimerase YddE/YHI9